MLHAKFGANRSNRLGRVQISTFFICSNFVNGKLPRKEAWLTPHNSAEFREHVDITMWDIMWELCAKNATCW